MLDVGVGLQITIALHALVGEAVQDGAALVTDGAACSEVVFHPGVGGPGLGNNKLGNYRETCPPLVSPQ